MADEHEESQHDDLQREPCTDASPDKPQAGVDPEADDDATAQADWDDPDGVFGEDATQPRAVSQT